jgi:copper homeostasis protein (lipoprotein)
MNSRFKFLGVLASVLITLNGCIEHREESKSFHSKPTSKEEQKFLKDKLYKSYRIYEGTIPCENCDKIEQRLVIKGDTAGIFRLSETYINATEDGDAMLVCSGEWVFSSSNRSTIYLSVGKIADSVRTMEYKTKNHGLQQMRADDELILKPENYRLKMVKSSK